MNHQHCVQSMKHGRQSVVCVNKRTCILTSTQVSSHIRYHRGTTTADIYLYIFFIYCRHPDINFIYEASPPVPRSKFHHGAPLAVSPSHCCKGTALAAKLPPDLQRQAIQTGDMSRGQRIVCNGESWHSQWFLMVSNAYEWFWLVTNGFLWSWTFDNGCYWLIMVDNSW